MTQIARLAKAPDIVQATFPISESGLANPVIDSLPESWRDNTSNEYFYIPPGWYLVKIDSTQGAESRFYTDRFDWLTYDGTLDRIVRINNGSRQRFLGDMSGGALSGKSLLACFQFIKPL